MPKLVFWPLVLVVFGLIIMAAQLGLLPAEFYNLWPLMLVVVGLGGLLTSDRVEWMSKTKPSSSSRATLSSAAKTRKTTKSAPVVTKKSPAKKARR